MKIASMANPRSRQEELGQFLTATPVADFMASMFDTLPSVVRLLDAGAGAGALTAAFVKRVCKREEGVRRPRQRVSNSSAEVSRRWAPWARSSVSLRKPQSTPMAVMPEARAKAMSIPESPT